MRKTLFVGRSWRDVAAAAVRQQTKQYGHANNTIENLETYRKPNLAVEEKSLLT